MVWETTLTCFTTGTFADIECLLSQGFYLIFGNSILVSLFVVFAGVLLSYKMRIPLDLTAIFLFGLIFILNLGVAEQWVFWVFILIMAIGSAYGYYKFTKR